MRIVAVVAMLLILATPSWSEDLPIWEQDSQELLSSLNMISLGLSKISETSTGIEELWRESYERQLDSLSDREKSLSGWELSLIEREQQQEELLLSFELAKTELAEAQATADRKIRRNRRIAIGGVTVAVLAVGVAVLR
jgi:hypothetical protein